jgi:hypothetical protein
MKFRFHTIVKQVAIHSTFDESETAPPPRPGERQLHDATNVNFIGNFMYITFVYVPTT